MWHIRQAQVLANCTADQVLERHLAEYTAANPGASDQDAAAHVLRHTVSKALPGSPARHHSQLQDLKCMVDAWGMPHGFITLTADEHSEFRWEEMADLDGLMRGVSANLNWEDAPVESCSTSASGPFGPSMLCPLRVLAYLGAWSITWCDTRCKVGAASMPISSYGSTQMM